MIKFHANYSVEFLPLFQRCCTIACQFLKSTVLIAQLFASDRGRCLEKRGVRRAVLASQHGNVWREHSQLVHSVGSGNYDPVISYIDALHSVMRNHVI